MAMDSSPICLRVSPEERKLLDVAAADVGKPLSAFMRHAGRVMAEEIIEKGGGMEAAYARYEESLARRAEFEDRERQLGH